MKVSIVYGSASDKPIMDKAEAVLEEFGVDFSSYIISAHRNPDKLEAAVRSFEDDGTAVIIAGAGLSAALPGVIASKTLIPVIGLPIKSGGLGGLDALLSIVQMPKPIPVATVGIDNAANAAYLALQIMAAFDEGLKKKLKDFRINL
ncbi:MAG: 5-(carboxyamino)imidazole ribonucleotide mutase [Spirochaetaceae bacterium]|jgi:5-(carboxyamino)imidazole ribonucleotide mutase|nr:5-(carboxyamino)imidazole ribonucleotide mutase [Spirochaetaceae bacterium]